MPQGRKFCLERPELDAALRAEEGFSLYSGSGGEYLRLMRSGRPFLIL
jgi:hypothetical protein